MCPLPPTVIDIRFVEPTRVPAVVEEAVIALAPRDQVVVVCNDDAFSACRVVVEEQERVSWDVLDARHGSIYVRIRRLC